MRHSWTVPVLLILAALAAYTLTTRPVRAQGAGWPFEVGDIVTFSFQDGDSRQCRIDDIRGSFARCGNTSDRHGPTIGRREPPEEWVNASVVEWVTKQRQER